MILDEIIEKRKIQLEREKSEFPFEKAKAEAEKYGRACVNFKKALASKERLSVIAEVKKASPSKGLIQPDFDPVKTAAAYEQSGADAVSCLTEEYYFQGSSAYFREIRRSIKLPMLRKDFIFDPYQIYEARLMGADAVLLIAAVLDDGRLKEYKKIAEAMGMDILTEVHGEIELERVLALGFDIIGINNRNLKTFEVSLGATERLAQLVPAGKVIVSESGIRNSEDMKSVRKYGADAVLIGETLMKSGDTGRTLRRLREGV